MYIPLTMLCKKFNMIIKLAIKLFCDSVYYVLRSIFRRIVLIFEIIF